MLLKTLAVSAPALAVGASAAAAPYTDAVLASNPVSYYQFEGNADDAGSGGNDGTLVGPASAFAPASFGIGQVFTDATGTDTAPGPGTNLIDLGLNGADSLFGDLQGSEAVSVEFIMDFDTVTSDGNVLFVPNPSNAAAVAVRVSSIGANIGGRSTGGDSFRNFGVFDGSVFDGPTHVVTIIDYAGDEIRVFADGVLVGSQAAAFNSDTLSFPTSDDPISIGASPSNNLAASYDELAIYGRALTASEIQGHFNAIPEPASLALVGAGAALMIGRRRK